MLYSDLPFWAEECRGCLMSWRTFLSRTCRIVISKVTQTHTRRESFGWRPACCLDVFVWICWVTDPPVKNVKCCIFERSIPKQGQRIRCTEKLQGRGRGFESSILTILEVTWHPVFQLQRLDIGDPRYPLSFAIRKTLQSESTCSR